MGEVMKSHISDYLEIAQAIYLDACARCAAEVSLRDLCTIKSRVENQGVSFLTITLPNFCSDFERSLDQGYIDSKSFRSFRKFRAIPAFLQGMLSRIFNLETGRINDEDTNSPNDHSAYVDSIRQICLAFKKVELPCTPEREYKALESFVAIENSFEMFSLPREDVERFSLVSSVLWDNIMGDLRLDMCIPRHGPGATADRFYGNRKYSWRKWHERLEPYFPLVDSCFATSSGELDFHSEELELVQFVHSEDEQPVKVTLVPKTLKGPRIIAIEPCCMQYAQQGLRREIYSLIESNWMTAGHINFRDQSVNQSLAMSSSRDGRLATIDLSDASDRVPRDLALEMFRSNPDFRDAIDACRSTSALLPDGRIISPLRKFASMGSALCFPVEAMYFYTICVMALLDSQNLPVTHANARRVSRDVYVYGDDIIVPTHFAAAVLDHLRKYNCKVNDRKTFFTGKFRESCGVDAYNGRPVRPVYIRTSRPKNRQQSSEILSWVDTANQFFGKGYLNTSTLLFKRVEEVLGPLPWVNERSQAIGRYHPWPSVLPKRFNRKYQRLEVRCWVPAPVYRTDELGGYAALKKCLMRMEGLIPSPNQTLVGTSDNVTALKDRIYLEAQGDIHHLRRSARYGAVTLKRRWVSATLIAGLR